MRTILRGIALAAAPALAAGEVKVETELAIRPDGKLERTFAVRSSAPLAKEAERFPPKEFVLPEGPFWTVEEKTETAWKGKATFADPAAVRDYRRKLPATRAESGQKVSLKKAETAFGTVHQYEETWRDTLHTREAMEVFRRHWNKGVFAAQAALKEAFAGEFDLARWDAFVEKELVPAGVGFADSALSLGWWDRAELEKSWDSTLSGLGLEDRTKGGEFTPFWPAELLEGTTLFPKFFALVARKESWTQAEKKAAEGAVRARFQEALARARAAILAGIESEMKDPKRRGELEADASKLFGCYLEPAGGSVLFTHRVKMPGTLAWASTVGESAPDAGSGDGTWEFGPEHLRDGFKAEAVSLAMSDAQKKTWGRIFSVPPEKAEAVGAAAAGVLFHPDFFARKEMLRLLRDCERDGGLSPLEEAAIGGDSDAARLMEAISSKQ